MHLDSKDSLGLSVNGIYEELTTNTVKEEVKEGFIVLDIGANIGYYTLLFSKLVGKEGKVFAFEPDPANFSLLKDNLLLNNCTNVISEQKGVADKNCKGKLYLGKNSSGGHQIFDFGEKRNFLEIELIRLDDYFKDFTKNIDFIKMDVEAAEILALKGMEEILRKNDNIKMIIEFWPWGLEKSGGKPKELFNLLEKHNFKFYELNESLKKLILTDADCLLKKCTTNKGYAGILNLSCSKK